MRKTVCALLALLLSLPPLASAQVFWEDSSPSYGDVYYDATTEPTSSDLSGEGSAPLAGDGIGWYVDGTTLYLSGQGDMYDFPNGAPWALYKTTLSRVMIGDGITSVGAYAFHDFDSLTSVEFGSSIQQIGAGAFYSCDALTSITLPDSFKKFGSDSFRSCSNLRQIHCSGGFPRFDENCLWDSAVTIYYSVNNPWPVSLVEQLETAFHNRIEFLASDGTDPYVPTEPTAATQPVYIPETTAPTQAPTYPTVQTEPATVPTAPQTVPTAPQPIPTTQPQAEPTRETFLMASQPTQPPAPRRDGGGSIVGVFIILVTLTISATAALLFRVSRSSGSRKKRRKRRK